MDKLIASPINGARNNLFTPKKAIDHHEQYSHMKQKIKDVSAWESLKPRIRVSKTFSHDERRKINVVLYRSVNMALFAETGSGESASPAVAAQEETTATEEKTPTATTETEVSGVDKSTTEPEVRGLDVITTVTKIRGFKASTVEASTVESSTVELRQRTVVSTRVHRGQRSCVTE